MIAFVLIGAACVVVGVLVVADIAGCARALSRYSERQRELRGWAAGTPVSSGQARVVGGGAVVVGLFFIVAALAT